MTREQVWRYVQELRSHAVQREQFEKVLADSKAGLELAAELGDTAQMERLRKARAEMQQAYDATTALLERKAGTSVERAFNLLQALEARLSAHGELQRELAMMEAHFEMAVACGEFDADAEAGRAAAEQMLGETRSRVDKQLELAAALVPDRPTLVLA